MTLLPRISAIVASAGTGKTTRIVEDIAHEVETRDPEQIVATTFTVKAADEIIERARARLFSIGRTDQAARLLGARFGTVNSVCAQIVAEHAFELEPCGNALCGWIRRACRAGAQYRLDLQGDSQMTNSSGQVAAEHRH